MRRSRLRQDAHRPELPRQRRAAFRRARGPHELRGKRKRPRFSVPNAETTAIFTNDPSCGKTLSDLAYITDTYWIPVNLIPPTNSPICQVINTKHMEVTVWDTDGWTYSNELCDFLEMDGFSPT